VSASQSAQHRTRVSESEPKRQRIGKEEERQRMLKEAEQQRIAQEEDRLRNARELSGRG